MSTAKWSLDPAHSDLQFKIKHLMITNVNGTFSQLAGNVNTEGDDFSNARVTFTIGAASISTNNEQRDGHLKSPDFFDVAVYPEITFEGTKFTKKTGEDYTLEGTLTMHGITKSVNLNVEYGGMQQDSYGQTKAGFEVNGKLNRKDFGLNWGAVTETGGVMLGDEVKFTANIQMVKQAG